MPSDVPSSPPSVPGLPTVTPPSGSMFFRLFGVPALIVGGLVLLLIVGQPLLGKLSKFVLGRSWGSASPEQVLRDLDNSNTEIRWRAANDLDQVLLRDNDLASNSDFALQLVQRLRRTLDSSAPFEKAHAEHFAKLSPQEEASELKKLDADRTYILWLTQCLGHFMVPVGAPVLEELATQTSGLDPRALTSRRLQALWALANLGENVKRFFEKLTAEQQEAVKAQLESAAGAPPLTPPLAGGQGGAAKAALDYLKRRQAGKPTALGVDRVIEKCADSDDPSLRLWAALAASFWSGTPAENTRMEKALLRLCDDPGKGEEELAKLTEENADQATRQLVKKPGFRVQVQAAIALARHGWKVRLTLLQTMLDEEELRSIFIVQSKKGGAEQPDRALVVETMLNALKAVVELHRKDPQRDLSSLRPNIDKLAHNPNPAVQTEAGRVVLALSKD
ncbi:MAG: hypothetical protein ACYC3I_24060 [Gemmataceae bacterium]